MNLITCDQNCRHNEDGYCALNQIAQLTNDNAEKCGYYQAAQHLNAKAEKSNTPQLAAGCGLLE